MNGRKAKALRKLAALQVGEKPTTYEIKNDSKVVLKTEAHMMRHPVTGELTEVQVPTEYHYGTLMLSPNCTRAVYKALKLAAQS